MGDSKDPFGAGRMCALVHAETGTILPEWRLGRLHRRGLLAERPRVGFARLYTRADVPEVIAAARRAGYLPVASESVTA